MDSKRDLIVSRRNGTRKATRPPGPPHDNSLSAQRERVLAWLRHSALTTLEARKHLDILHPAGRVLELRQRGHDIVTSWTFEETRHGVRHRVGKYVLLPSQKRKPS